MHYFWRVVPLAFAAPLVASLACSDDSTVVPSQQVASVEAVLGLDYAREESWLCDPTADTDWCRSADLTATEVRADGTVSTSVHSQAANPGFDCFYVYPTVDLRQEPGNTTDFSDVRPILAPLLNQAAWFTGVCRVFAPAYQQMTYSTYFDPRGYESTEPFAAAYADVAAAFDHYMAEHNAGRGVVLIGHSQGSHMLARLLEERFDGDEMLRQQLVSALLIGPTGRVQVPQGAMVGGTFDNLPLCQFAEQTGCLISYDSEAADIESLRSDAVPIAAGQQRACTNPAELSGAEGVLSATVWSTQGDVQFPDEVDQPWVRFPERHTASCGANGALQIGDVAGDPRPLELTPQQLQARLESDSSFALHIVDVNYALGDLLSIVAAQGAAHQAPER